MSHLQASQAMMPFAIVGSEEEIEVNGEPIRARRYPWGIVEVDNPQHSDFGRLRNALLSTHLTDLKEITVCPNHCGLKEGTEADVFRPCCPFFPSLFFFAHP